MPQVFDVRDSTGRRTFLVALSPIPCATDVERARRGTPGDPKTAARGGRRRAGRHDRRHGRRGPTQTWRAGAREEGLGGEQAVIGCHIPASVSLKGDALPSLVRPERTRSRLATVTVVCLFLAVAAGAMTLVQFTCEGRRKEA